MSIAPTVGFLHTSPVHVATFDALLAGLDPRARAHHVVDEALLRDAAGGAPPADLARRLASHRSGLARHGVSVVVVTCSTLGPLAEASSAEGAIVLRVDRPMAELAVRAGRRVGVVVALRATLAPTLDLLAGCAAVEGLPCEPVVQICPHAWEQFTGGRHREYAASVARATRSLAGITDVVVLAQASMAVALPLLGAVGVPVLSSPATATARALELAGARERVHDPE